MWYQNCYIDFFSFVWSLPPSRPTLRSMKSNQHSKLLTLKIDSFYISWFFFNISLNSSSYPSFHYATPFDDITLRCYFFLLISLATKIDIRISYFLNQYSSLKYIPSWLVSPFFSKYGQNQNSKFWKLPIVSPPEVAKKLVSPDTI